MTSKYKPKDFDEYRKLILPAFNHAKEQCSKRKTGLIWLVLIEYHRMQPQNRKCRWGLAECLRLLRSSLGPEMEVSLWAEEAGMGTRFEFSGYTRKGQKLVQATIR